MSISTPSVTTKVISTKFHPIYIEHTWRVRSTSFDVRVDLINYIWLLLGEVSCLRHAIKHANKWFSFLYHWILISNQQRVFAALESNSHHTQNKGRWKLLLFWRFVVFVWKMFGHNFCAYWDCAFYFTISRFIPKFFDVLNPSKYFHCQRERIFFIDLNTFPSRRNYVVKYKIG